MDLEWLEDFILLIDSGGFSRAAEKRGLGQPAFSRRIIALENWVGASLLVRGSHRVTLTPAGERFRSLSEEILRRLHQGREEVTELGKISSSALRFSCTYALSLSFFTPWLKVVEEDSPIQANIRLSVESTSACEKMMIQGHAQFLMCHHHGLIPSPLEVSQFTSIKIQDDPLIPICAPDDESAPLFNLDAKPNFPIKFLSYVKESGLARILEGVWEVEGVPPNLELVFTSHASTTLAAMARDGRGVAWIPQSFAMEDLERGRLVRAGGSKWDLLTEIRLYRPKARQSASAEKFWSSVLSKSARPNSREA
jgi:DNA-binding transcriptional LysR family regulator